MTTTTFDEPALDIAATPQTHPAHPRSLEAARLFAGLIIGTALLASVAIWNGFPLVYYDSGSYLAMSIQHWPHFERPIPYGLFIGLAGLEKTLWGAIAGQSLILFSLIYFAFWRLARAPYPLTAALGATLILVLFTAAGYTTGFLMPDAFTPIAALATALLLATPALRSWELAVLSTIAIAANVTHLSHLLQSSAFALLLLAACGFANLCRRPLPIHRIRIATVAAVAISSWLTLLVINAVITHRLFISDSTSIFLAGKLADTGLLKDYLDRYGQQNGYQLSKYKDRFPMTSIQFLWKDISPLKAMGGWKASKPDCDRIVRDMLIRPPYLARFIWASLRDGTRMCLNFDVYTFPAFLERSEVLPPLRQYYPRDLPAYLNARQQHGELVDQSNRSSFTRLNRSQNALVSLSLLAIAAVFTIPRYRQRIPAPTLLCAAALLTFVLLNGYICGALSAIIDARYQSRIIWLLPLAAMLLLSSLWTNPLTTAKKSYTN